MASDYSRTCVSPDSIQTGEAPVVSETCEVYVWGSNSSHQLVEGTQEKILQPKLAATFADAQTVRGSQDSSRNLLVPGSRPLTSVPADIDLSVGLQAGRGSERLQDP